MHPYSTNSGERSQIPFFIACVAFLLAWVVAALVKKIHNVPFYVEIPGTFTLYGVLLAVFRSYCWRWRWLRSTGIEARRVISQPKFSTTPDELRDWKMRAQQEQDQFDEDMMRIHSVPVTAPAIPAERGLWEELKRADTGAQVRRIYKRSKIWLKTRREFPDGGFAEYWYWRRVLYDQAEKFCQAKLDSRYPSRDQRQSGDYRRVEYLARVMAGLTLRLAPSTAVEMLRKLIHSEKCSCWRCSFKIAPRYPTSLAVFLARGDWFRRG